MSDERMGKDIGRRQFLKSALIGGGAVAVVAASGGAHAAPEAEAPAAAPAAKPQGYHVTPHILEYYKKAQF